MKTRQLSQFVFVLLIAILFFGCERKPGEKLYHNAMTEWEKGHLVRARTLLEKSILRQTGSSSNADAQNRLGLILWEMDEVDSAVDAFNESCRIDAGQYDTLCNLGVALNDQGDFDGAERAFREAALLKPDDPRPLIFAGAAYLQSGKWAEAEHNLRRASDRAPNDPQLQMLLALAELQTRGTGAALQRLQFAVKNHPDYTPALFNLAAVYRYELHNTAEAKRCLESYLKKTPDTNPRTASARKQLQELSTQGSGSGIPFTAPSNPNRAEAEKKFQTALRFHQKGDLTQAIAGYIQSLEADNTYERAFYNLGLVYYASNQMTLASEAFQRAVQINPAFVNARYNAALVDYYQLGQTDRALGELKIVLSQQPDYQPAIDLLNKIKSN